MSDEDFGQFAYIEEYTRELFSKNTSDDFLDRFLRENPILAPIIKSPRKQESISQKNDDREVFKKCSFKK